MSSLMYSENIGMLLTRATSFLMGDSAHLFSEQDIIRLKAGLRAHILPLHLANNPYSEQFDNWLISDDCFMKFAQGVLTYKNFLDILKASNHGDVSSPEEYSQGFLSDAINKLREGDLTNRSIFKFKEPAKTKTPLSPTYKALRNQIRRNPINYSDAKRQMFQATFYQVRQGLRLSEREENALFRLVSLVGLTLGTKALKTIPSYQTLKRLAQSPAQYSATKYLNDLAKRFITDDNLISLKHLQIAQIAQILDFTLAENSIQKISKSFIQVVKQAKKLMGNHFSKLIPDQKKQLFQAINSYPQSMWTTLQPFKLKFVLLKRDTHFQKTFQEYVTSLHGFKMTTSPLVSPTASTVSMASSASTRSRTDSGSSTSIMPENEAHLCAIKERVCKAHTMRILSSADKDIQKILFKEVFERLNAISVTSKADVNKLNIQLFDLPTYSESKKESNFLFDLNVALQGIDGTLNYDSASTCSSSTSSDGEPSPVAKPATVMRALHAHPPGGEPDPFVAATPSTAVMA